MTEIQTIFRFLSRLSENNTREWVAEHKDEYELVKKLRDDVATQFINTVATVDPEAALLPLNKCVYRLVRDTRFSEDKTPYKTHVGIYVCPPYGKKSLMAGYYLHLEPGASMLWGGCYGLPTRYLTAIRADIRDNIEEYLSIVEAPEFRKIFPKVGDDPLKTAPKGFDRQWEYLDYVRPREFGVCIHLSDSYFDDDNYMQKFEPALKQIKRYNDFLNYTLTESGFPLMREGR